MLELRNRAEHSLAAQNDVGYDEDTFIVRFKQLVVPDVAYDLRTMEYTYDALSRLAEARYNPGANVGAADGDLLRRYQYTYDVAGNRLSESVAVDGGTPTVTNYTNAANQVTNIGFAYDDNGNLTNDGTYTYTWDRANRLTQVSDAVTTEQYGYDYDGLGNRIAQQYSQTNPQMGWVEQYLLDLQPGLVKVLATEFSVPPSPFATTTRFVHGPRGIHAQEDSSGDWTWTLQDGLGSVRGVIDDDVSVDSVQSYAPYGAELEAGIFGSPFTFTGEQTDANGLVYLRARYYHPDLGVFPSLDPVEGDIGRAMSLNRYGYVAGNVVNAVDPSGLAPNCAYRHQGSIVDLLPSPVPDLFFSFAHLHSTDCMECTTLCTTINQNCLTGDRGFLLGTDQIHGDIRGMSKCEADCASIFPGQNCYPASGTILQCVEDAVRIVLNTLNDLKKSDKHFVTGVRLDGSVVGGLGADINVEVYCTIPGWAEAYLLPVELLGFDVDLGGRCGYFLNVGLEFGAEVGAGVNIGALVGRIEFPDEPGVYAVSGTLGVTFAGGVGMEGDITLSEDGGFVVFGGVGAGVGGGDYGNISLSIYLGASPQEAHQTLEDISRAINEHRLQ
ncbi:MAG: hypothetical protein K8S97_16075 [Anaerolineae bacterium]|nr:hypothetical protein [Anaerolineae bacterium]